MSGETFIPDKGPEMTAPILPRTSRRRSKKKARPFEVHSNYGIANDVMGFLHDLDHYKKKLGKTKKGALLVREIDSSSAYSPRARAISHGTSTLRNREASMSPTRTPRLRSMVSWFATVRHSTRSGSNIRATWVKERSEGF
jgi:hypothetical protein